MLEDFGRFRHGLLLQPAQVGRLACYRTADFNGSSTVYQYMQWVPRDLQARA